MLHRETDEDVEDTHSRSGYGKDREITLGTTMVLGIFFALAVFGSVFFGIGYSLGSKRAATLAPAPIVEGGTSFNSFKPAPGSPLITATAKPADSTSLPFVPTSTPPPATLVVPKALASAKPEADTAEDEAPARPAVRALIPSAASPATAATAAAAMAATRAAASPGTSVVQVAAVSHQEDADLLVSTLKRRGYAVGIRNEPQDKLLHVQIGPFATRKDADAMRQKLLADGFNAIVK